MARPVGPVQGVSSQEVVTFFCAASMWVISPRAGRATKILPLPSATAEPGRPGREMVAVTWLVALSMTVTEWSCELKAKTDFVAGSKTIDAGMRPVGIEVTSLRVERSKTRTKLAVPSVG